VELTLGLTEWGFTVKKAKLTRNEAVSQGNKGERRMSKHFLKNAENYKGTNSHPVTYPPQEETPFPKKKQQPLSLLTLTTLNRSQKGETWEKHGGGSKKHEHRYNGAGG